MAERRAMMDALLANLPPGIGGVPPEALRGMLGSMPDDVFEKMMQELEDKADGAGGGHAVESHAGAGDGRRAVDKDLERKAYEDALKHSCNTQVVADYEALPPDAKQLMLKAFQATVEDNHSKYVEKVAMDKAMGKGPKIKAIAAPKDPLVRALSLFWRGEEDISRGAADHVRQVASKWGMPWPAFVRRMQYETQIGSMRMQFLQPGDEDDPHTINQYRTDKTVVKSAQGQKRKWDSLRPIHVDDLKLFQVAKGCVLSGQLVGDPFATVGVTTLLEDSSGSVVQLGLYNMLPGGPTGRKAFLMAEQMFPKGTKLSIAEPFLKIFQDGNRGVRVDDPPDVRFEAGEAEGSVAALDDVRSRGKELVKEKAYAAAATVYWQGLRADRMWPSSCRTERRPI